ncbi:hypothetical protein ACN4EG_23590 [Alkalinema pantanalense CENA528]|uniref:hypothetical protein n=1 Tax=Alkalinema pantanalense TaxID=1620705 RepID=UPI003D6E8037
MRQLSTVLGFPMLIGILLVSCTSQPKPPAASPSPTLSPSSSVLQPINKAQDAQSNVEQKAKEREQYDPEKASQSGQ